MNLKNDGTNAEAWINEIHKFRSIHSENQTHYNMLCRDFNDYVKISGQIDTPIEQVTGFIRIMGFTDLITAPIGLNISTNPIISRPIAPVLPETPAIPIDQQNINTRSNTAPVPHAPPDYARLNYELERFKIQSEIYKNEQKKFKNTFHTYQDLRDQIIITLPNYIKDILTSNNEVLSSLPIHTILQAVYNEFQVVSEFRIQEVIRDLGNTLLKPADLVIHLNSFSKNMKLLTSYGQETGSYTSIQMLIKTIDMHASISSVIDEYRRDNPAVLNQTFSGLTQYLKEQKENIFRKDVTMLEALTGHTANNTKKIATDKPTEYSNLKYCWHHGYCNHYGHKCKFIIDNPETYTEEQVHAKSHKLKGKPDGKNEVYKNKNYKWDLQEIDYDYLKHNYVNKKNYIKKNKITISNSAKYKLPEANNRDNKKNGIADTGTTDTLFKYEDLDNISEINSNKIIHVELPNGNVITSTGKAESYIGNIKIEGNTFEEGKLDKSLISISDLCNNQNCTCIFDKKGLTITKDNKKLHYPKPPNDTLWYIPFNTTPVKEIRKTTNSKANSVVKFDNTKQEIQHFFRVWGNFPISTIIKAITAGYLEGYPDLPTPEKILANKPNPIPIAMGHMKQTRKGMNPTKIGISNHQIKSEIKLDVDKHELHEGIDEIINLEGHKANHAYSFVISRDENTNSSDATGPFPFPSIEGFKYLFVSVYNGMIIIQAMENRTSATYEKTYQDLYETFNKYGHKPKFQRIDNEKSAQVLDFLNKQGVKIQLVPPDMHRANKAERAIQTVKRGFISMLVGSDIDCQYNLWAKGIPQLQIIINHLRPWHPDPTISAYEGFHRKKYNFVDQPIAPFGQRIIAQVKNGISAGVKATEGTYIGPAPDHHRCWRFNDNHTKKDRVTDTMEIVPRDYIEPGASLIEQLQNTFVETIQTLNNAVSIMKKLRDNDEINEDDELHYDKDLKQFEESTNKIAQYFHQHAVEKPKGIKQGPATKYIEDNDTIPDPKDENHKDCQHKTTDPVDEDEENNNSEQNSKKQTETFTDNIVNNQDKDVTVPIQGVKSAITPTVSTQGVKPKSTPTQVPNIIQTRNLATRRGSSAAAIKSKEELEVEAKVAEKHADITIKPILGLDENGNKLKFKAAIIGPNKDIWYEKNIEEYSRLFDNKTWKAIHPQDQPKNRIKDTMYTSKQISEKYDNSEQYLAEGGIKRRVRLTTGGDKANYHGYTKADTADLVVVKLLLNSVISDPKAKFASIDIENFYLNKQNVLDRPEYIKLKTKEVPQEIIDKYKLQDFIYNDHILLEIITGMYGLSQAGRIAQEQLILKLAESGYSMVDNVKCLFIHETKPTMFTLTVDDFGVKYNSEEDLQHLIKSLEKIYKIKINLKGDKYLGMNLTWNYEERTVQIALNGYINKLMSQHPQFKKQASTPYIYSRPKYGLKEQQQIKHDDSNPISESDKKTIQKIIGSLSYYARIADPTLLTVVNEIASESAKPTENTMKKVARMMGYVRAFPDNFTKYYKSDMILKIQSDASFNSRCKGKSVQGGIHYLTNHDKIHDNDYINAPINCICSQINVVVLSAAEAEYAAVSKNAREGIYERQILEAMGYSQPATTILTDNEVAIGLTYDTLKQNASKSIDIRFHFIRDRVRQKQFTVNFIEGVNNLADFFTKSLPDAKFKELIHKIVKVPFISTDHFQRNKSNRSNIYRNNKFN